MNQQSRDLRREANRAFLESLQALAGDTMAPASPAPLSPVCYPTAEQSPRCLERESSLGFNPSELEQAIADIDQYLQQQRD
ncbi:hypothetical protein OOK60_18625 [Trichothermofontia sichuanensis B231]|uniref:hypothetical protein n=1 Tax=Trichothermofontia sichuanensis TaxID=3045816 RepID=UPI00224719BE|nr:hypothetical protein [Trichothermofontia sichuanensis]UZQ54453.1 hypothetical protein OOK60_18625 [Trichothermofontia sichuanensis B231]